MRGRSVIPRKIEKDITLSLSSKKDKVFKKMKKRRRNKKITRII
jgi:hypothetical protein